MPSVGHAPPPSVRFAFRSADVRCPPASARLGFEDASEFDPATFDVAETDRLLRV